MTTEHDIPDVISVVPEPSEKMLNKKQIVDYEFHRERLITWALACGKDPDTEEGYAVETVRTRAYRLDEFYRWIWDREDGYTRWITPEHATEYLQYLATLDCSNSYRSSVQNAIQMLFDWRNQEQGDDIEWDADIDYTTNNSQEPPSDVLSGDEIRKLKSAAAQLGSIPHYNSLSADERSKWKSYLAQRFDKPKQEITKDEWDRANGFKYQSLVQVSLDAGLRPFEVAEASVDWVDTEMWILRIPAETTESDRSTWEIALSEETAGVLRGWLQEREQYEKYDGTDALWLTRRGNRYGTRSLNYLFDRLCEEANFETGHRSLSWTTLRDTVGAQMAKRTNITEIRKQLRHESVESAEKYRLWEHEQRRDVLEEL